METDVEAEPMLPPSERLELYRSSLRDRCTDVLEDVAAWAVGYKAWALSNPVIRALLVFVARVSFVADLALDINVGLELRASGNFWWSGICFSIILFTYLVLACALREKAVQRLQSGCLPERPRAAKALWILLSVPLLVATDILVTLRYLWQDPLEVEVFHFLKLRGLLEAVEAMLQTLLQSYVAFRLLNPGGFFAEVEAKQVKPTALCLSIVFSIKNLGEQFLFLEKFSKLQTHGDKKLFLKTMCALGDGLAPSSLFDQVARSRYVNCEFDLGEVDRSELWVLARAARDSPVLEELRFAKASFLRTLVRTPTQTNLLKSWVNELLHSRHLQRLYIDGTSIGMGLVEEEIWEAVLKVFAESAESMPRHSLERIEVAGREPVLLKPCAEPWRRALFQATWPELRLALQREKLLPAEVGESLFVAAGLQRLTKHLGLLISLGASPNGNGKKLPLISAALQNASGNAKLLLEHRAHVDATSGSGLTALYGAAQANAAQTLQVLLQHKAEVNLAIGPKKLTALHIAARGTCNDALRMLLEHEADPNKANTDGVTAVHVACEASHLNAVSCVEFLLAHKADANKLTASRRTPLHYALRSPSIALGTALLQPLLENGADANHADDGGDVPLCLAVEKNAATAVQLLLERRAELHSATVPGQTPLHLAAECKSLESMKVLLMWRADVSRVNEHGRTPLLDAAAENSVPCARMLLEYRSDVNHCESGRGETALMMFGMRHSAEGLRLLLEAGADPTLKTTDGYRVDDLAVSESKEIQELLKGVLE